MKLILIASLVLGVTAFAAAQQDPVGHPAGYKSFEQVRSMDRPQEPSHGTVFLNPAAASIKKAGEPYPFGSVADHGMAEGRQGR